MNDESLYKKAKILIIDDEKTVCVALKHILEKTGKYELWSTTNPIEGLNLAYEKHPDLILLDIVMPEMDGSEVAAHLTNDPSTKDILILFVTVLADHNAVENNEGFIGGYPFISKPVSIHTLIARIDSLLQEVPINN